MHFHRRIADEEFKKWCSDDKFLIMGPGQEIPRHEKILYIIVRDLMPNSEFLKKYGHLIKRLRIYCEGINKTEPFIYNEISENCSENLQEIEFYDLEGDEPHKFQKQFEKIERVQFKNGTIGHKSWNATKAFKENFSNVRQMEFSHKLTAINDRDIINQHYPNLEHFEASYNDDGKIFNESNIMNALKLNKKHLKTMKLWGKLSPGMLKFDSEEFPDLEKLSIKGVPQSVFTYPSRYIFKQLNEFEMSTKYDGSGFPFRFHFESLTKITLDLPNLPDPWIDDFAPKNRQIHYLSLSVKPTMVCDSTVSKMKRTLPNLKYFEIDYASNLASSTIIDLLKDGHLNELLFSNLNGITYGGLKSNAKQIKSLGWNVQFFSEIFGAKFERITGILKAANFFVNNFKLGSDLVGRMKTKILILNFNIVSSFFF